MNSHLFSCPHTALKTAVLMICLPAARLQALPGEVVPARTLPVFQTRGQVRALAEQADGKTLIAGEFWSLNGVPARGLARLNPDGSVDQSFTAGIGLGLGNVSFGGDSLSDLRTTRPNIKLLPLPDGRIWVEARNNSSVLWTVLAPDGTRLMQAFPDLPASGGPVLLFAEGVVNGVLALSEESRTVSSGATTRLKGTIRGVDPGNGRTVWTFARTQDPQPLRAWPASDSGWWVAGEYVSYPLAQNTRGSVKHIWKLNPDGKPDLSVLPVRYAEKFVQDFQPLPNGRLMVMSRGYSPYVSLIVGPPPTNDSVQVQTFPPLDKRGNEFLTTQCVYNSLQTTALSDGSIMTSLASKTAWRKIWPSGATAGEFVTPPPFPPKSSFLKEPTLALPEGAFQLGVNRYRADGTPDSVWKAPFPLLPFRPLMVAAFPEGRFWVRGNSFQQDGSYVSVRSLMHRSGAPDDSFRPSPEIASTMSRIAAGPPGTVYVRYTRTLADGTATGRLARLFLDGSIDPSFRPFENSLPAVVPGEIEAGNAGPFAVFPDGSLLVTLTVNLIGSTTRIRTYWRRLTADGTVMPDYPVPIVASTIPFLVASADGTFWVGPQRFKPDGTKDFLLPFVPSTGFPPCELDDGTILFKQTASLALHAVLPGGGLDPAFVSPARSANDFDPLDPAPGGGFFIGRDAGGSTLRPNKGLLRCRRDGTVDPSFRFEHLTHRLVAHGDVFTAFGEVQEGGLQNIRQARRILASGDRAWLWGEFTHVGDRQQNGLAILDISRPATFSDWSAATFRLQPPPVVDQGPEADPDRDGVSNFLEFAMGTDPLDPLDGRSQPVLESRDPLVFKMRWNPDATRVATIVESSSDLARWNRLPESAYSFTNYGGHARVQIHSANRTTSYFRVRFEALSP